ncbi:MAG: MraZ N-terminal domain containing protein, partial [Lachnospiraceae bacterium]|nr:MraZ N-terminal domain containing protein [Lachnospiraceae bacterium]
MNKLAGKFEHTCDAKGRIIVPSKIREVLGESFIVTLGMDGCLYNFSDDG